jgi:hypothetical protein
MSRWIWRVLLSTAFVATCCAAAELDRVKTEPNLEKRSKLALDNAAAAFKAAHEAYEKGDVEQAKEGLAELQRSVELAGDSLKQTGKDPRRNPRWFKNAELGTRGLLRKLDGLRQEMSVSDRPLIEPVMAKVQQVHDDLLEGLMEGKRK